MNMAKNNDKKILEKNKEYSVKHKKYNELKESYRKRMIIWEEKKSKRGQKETGFREDNDSVIKSA
jgi:hypothetical protein